MKSLVLIILVCMTAGALGLGDRSPLPASSESLSGTASTLNQVTPEEVEREDIRHPQDIQEWQYQQDLKREKEKEQAVKKKLQAL